MLQDLQKEFKFIYFFIAHDLKVVEHISDRIAVMYLGKIAELARAEELYASPQHPYTQALLSAIPVADPDHKHDRIILSGDVPSPINPPGGCFFHPRCSRAKENCRSDRPLLRVAPKIDQKSHEVSCHYPG